MKYRKTIDNEKKFNSVNRGCFNIELPRIVDTKQLSEVPLNCNKIVIALSSWHMRKVQILCRSYGTMEQVYIPNKDSARIDSV